METTTEEIAQTEETEQPSSSRKATAMVLSVAVGIVLTGVASMLIEKATDKVKNKIAPPQEETE